MDREAWCAAVNDKVYNKLVDLCVDICERNGINKLLWFGSEEATLSYNLNDGEAVLTAHRWFAAKACPGDWLYSRYGELANAVNIRLNKSEESATKKDVLYKVQVGAFSKKENAEELLSKIKAAGFNGFIAEIPK